MIKEAPVVLAPQVECKPRAAATGGTVFCPAGPPEVQSFSVSKHILMRRPRASCQLQGNSSASPYGADSHRCLARSLELRRTQDS